MSEEIKKILNKFDGVLKNYELDKAFGQLSVDSICHLFPSEIITIKNYIQQKENIIKEVREFVEKHKNNLLNTFDEDVIYGDVLKPILEILDKGE